MRSEKSTIFENSLVIISHPWFLTFINLTIIANTIVLAQDRFNIDPKTLQKLENANLVFFTVFAIEMVLKIIGLGFRIYAHDNFNLFDALIVGVSLIDILLSYLKVQSIGAVSALRTFRLLRIFKLAQSWKQF